MAHLILRNVRLSFPDLFVPGAPIPGSTGGPKYGAQFIMEPNSEAFKTASEGFFAVAKEKFGQNWQAILNSMEKSKKAIRKGDDNLDKSGNVRDGYAGMFYVVARNKAKPAVVDSKFNNGQPVPLEASSGKPYGGCYVNAKVEFYAMDKPGKGKSLNCTLLAVQFVRDGDAFAGGPGTADGFEDMGGDEGEGGNTDGTPNAANLF